MEKMEPKGRIILVPAPAQGHLTPMMQLGTALSLKGFSVTVVQAQFNQVNSCSQNFFPSFHFVTLPETLPKSDIRRLGIFKFLLEFNKANEAGFKNCIAQLLQLQSNGIACIIYDEFMYFSEAAAKEFKLPSVMFTTQSATNQASRSVFNKLNTEKFLVDMEDSEMQEKMVENMHPLRYKDLMPRGFGTLNTYSELLGEVLNKRRTASAVILNTVRCLESSSLAWLQQELGVPTYSIGPLHITASAPCSLFEEDKSCIEWLSMQKPRSVIYISLGSIALSETKDVLEMAWGFINSNQPFLWVIRPGSIPGSEWIESFPEGISKMVAERGKIVKWVPQKDVLAHPAVGGFWSHCGWNSTLESIVEGVPLICRPSDSEQMLNALYIENVWRVGIQFEGELERGGVERAVKRLMGEEEGAGMRERAHALKEKVRASVRSGGSSYNALDELVKNLKTN